MPRIDLDKIFGVSARTMKRVLCKPGVGFYVPVYQREYDWDNDHISRLFEDIGYGLQLLVQNANSITFLGSLILLDNTIPPNVDRNELPSEVRIVIDGQQRLTTILLTNICLHDEIRRRKIDFNIEDNLAFWWLYRKARSAERQLKKTFAEDMGEGDGVYQWYPRMIRESGDLWSSSEGKAKYKSPIAAFIHGYLRHISGDDRTERYRDQNDKSSALMNRYGMIQEEVKDVWKRGAANLEVPLLDKIIESGIFQRTIFQAEFPAEVRSILSNDGNEDFKELIGLVALANFLMEGVTVTVTSVYKQDYAFDMFESLNTTGEPLTALETFKPKVVEAEELNKYEESCSRKLMKPIEEYMEEFKKAEKRHSETSRLLIPFALAETGEALPKRHSSQRKYLRDQYDKLENIEEKREFVRHLSHTASFFKNAWKKKKNAFQSIENFSNESVVLMCMDMLGKVNHEIAIGPLVRFYSQIIHSNSSPEAVKELEGAIKAITAFFTFWRGIPKETGYLADQYRGLMKKGSDRPDGRAQAFCRRSEDTEVQVLENLTAQELKEALRYILKEEGEITCKDDWVTFSAALPVYQGHKTLARFLLFAALHNTSEDEENPGLRLAGQEGILDMLTWEKWSQDLEIEHIAPQNPEPDSWSEALYGKRNLIDHLGNLTLLPKAENSSFGNKPWQTKKVMYHLLASRTPHELNTRLEEARTNGIRLSHGTEELLRNRRYFHHLSAIYKAKNWDEKFIRKRSKRLAELVWTNIAPWLGIDGDII